MRQLKETVSGSSTLGKIAEQIARQQKVIDGMTIPDLARPIAELPKSLSLADIEVPPHPAHETNERLERIEAQFGQMQGVAMEAAAIANGLQGAAAEFLIKFEDAATNNDRAARRAIRIGAAAMAIAVLAPLVQIIYTEFWRVPDDAAALQAALLEMKAEIAGIREEQANVAAGIATTLLDADRDNTELLRDIRDLLGSMQPAAAPESIPAE